MGSRDAVIPATAWADRLAARYVRLEPRFASRADREAFRGRIDHGRAGDVDVTRVRASAHGVHRLAEHAAREDRAVAFANLQMAGRGRIERRGAAHGLRPWDVVVVDATEPFSIEHGADFELLSVVVPLERASLALLRGAPLALSGSAAGRGISELLLRLGRMCLRPELAASREMLARQFEAVLGHAADVAALAPVEARASVRTDALLALVDARFAEEGLNARALARTLGVSTSYVHRLARPTGRTVSGLIGDRRLDAVAEALAREPAHVPVSHLAHRAGFADASRFHRLFRERFGCTPVALREARRGR